MLAAARTRRPLTACNSVLLKKRPWVSADAIASVIGVFIGENLLDSFLLVLLEEAQLRFELFVIFRQQQPQHGQSSWQLQKPRNYNHLW